MTRLLSTLAWLAFSLTAPAQEVIPREEAQRIAQKLREHLGAPSDTPFFVDADAEKPHALKSGQIGLLVMPERTLNSAQLDSAGRSVVPVGHLWTRGLSPVVEDRPLAESQQRTITFGEGDGQEKVQLYFLGAAKNETGQLELLVFAKDATQPVFRVALQKSTATSQTDPLEIEGRKEEDRGLLTLHIASAYTAVLSLKESE